MMSAKKKKDSVETGQAKAPLSEIFAAMEGIRSAGVAVVKDGKSTKDPVADLAITACYKSLEAKTILKGSGDGRLQTELAARKLTDFMNLARMQLYDHSNLVLRHAYANVKGGKVSELVAHIEDILMREALPAERKLQVIADGGLPSRTFNAAYLPGVKKSKTSRAKGARVVPLEPEKEIQPAFA